VRPLQVPAGERLPENRCNGSKPARYHLSHAHRSVCIVYRWGRLSSIFVGFFIAFFLREFGVDRVFAIIAGAMEIVAIALARYWAWRSTRSLYE
jgi:hypothetical protein